MNKYEFIDRIKVDLNAANEAVNEARLDAYSSHMTNILDLLLEELIGGPPNPAAAHPAKFNPEKCLVDVANAVRHRPIAITERWKIIYYHTRICCVPMTCAVPDQIVIHTFTEKMAREGFSTVYWHKTKMNIISLCKELEL